MIGCRVTDEAHMRTRATSVLLALAFAASGCGGDPAATPMDAGSASVINGHPFPVLGQSVIIGDDPITKQPAWYVVELWDSYNPCAGPAQNPPANSVHLQLIFTTLNPMGTYTSSGSGASVAFVIGDDNIIGETTTWTIKVVTFKKDPPGKITGTYDVFFKTGEHLFGTFDAPIC
jgi:hypothetical protein